MAAGGVFQLISSDGMQDRMLMASRLLSDRKAASEVQKRLEKIAGKPGVLQKYQQTTPRNFLFTLDAPNIYRVCLLGNLRTESWQNPAAFDTATWEFLTLESAKNAFEIHSEKIQQLNPLAVMEQISSFHEKHIAEMVKVIKSVLIVLHIPNVLADLMCSYINFDHDKASLDLFAEG